MSVTLGPRLGLMLNAAAGDAHPNEFRAFLRGMDALSQISVKSRTTTAQPASPTNGDTYILTSSPTGSDWGGKAAGTIAYYTTQKTTTSGGSESTTTGWDFITPKRGFYANVEDEGDACYRYDGSAWQVFYKEGTWTPVIKGSTTAGTHTYGSQHGSYTRVGRMTHARFRMQLSAKDAAMAGTVLIGGFPFTSEPTADTQNSGFLGFISDVTLDSGKTSLHLRLSVGTTNAALGQFQSGASSIDLPVNAISNTTALIGAIIYHS